MLRVSQGSARPRSMLKVVLGRTPTVFRALDYLEGRPRHVTLMLSLVMIGFLGLVDYWTGAGTFYRDFLPHPDCAHRLGRHRALGHDFGERRHGVLALGGFSWRYRLHQPARSLLERAAAFCLLCRRELFDGVCAVVAGRASTPCRAPTR